MQSNLSLLDRLNEWIRESIMIKLLSIGFLVLILLIPATWISSLIDERQGRADGVVSEITSKWSGTQRITGPVLSIPFTKIERVKRWEDGKQIEEQVETRNYAYFLPEHLGSEGSMDPQVLHRGIFEAVVYESKLHLDASFGPPDFAKWNIPDEQVDWKEARLILGITDLLGISENPVIRSGDKDYASEPSTDIGIAVDSNATRGVQADLGWSKKEDFVSDFGIDLQLKGSDLLYFVPVGKTTDVRLSSSWATPSFDGELLPDTREVSAQGFSATWKVLSFNRPFAQQWTNDEQRLDDAAFGVRLLIPADQYQKSTRTAKYSILIILLAFTALFLVEITTRVRIHPFQYILIGVALMVYYTLLLSISEHAGYNAAYAIASIATVALVSLYSRSFLGRSAMTALFTGLMAIAYTFIFVIIQAEDFSLLIGSAGLFILIAAVMYFSRNISWYRT